MNIKDVESYIHGILIGADEAAAAALFNGTNDMSISTRCGMALLGDVSATHKIEGKALEVLGRVLDEVQRDHCYQAIYADYARAKAMLEVLQPYVTQLSQKGVQPK